MSYRLRVRVPRAHSVRRAGSIVVGLGLLALSLTAVAHSAHAQSLPALPNLSVATTSSTPNSPNCTASSSSATVYACSSPTVTLFGTGAPASTNIVVADSNGYWLGETQSGSDGSWSLPVTLLYNTNGNSSSYTLDAFQVNVGANEEGSPSPTVSVTVNGNQLVTNGSFEQPSLAALNAPDGWLNFGPGQVPGWAATNPCGIELQSQITVGVKPYDGLQYAELASNCVSGVTQTIATVPGTQYSLSFAFQARPTTGLESQAVENMMAVKWGGQTVAPSLEGGSSWQVYTYVVTATSTSTVLEFDDTNPDSADTYGDFLDNVSVVPTASLAPANTSWMNAQNVPPTSSTPGFTGSTSQSITYSGEGLWYDFPIQPGEQVNVQLSNLAANYHVLLFSDLSQAQQSLTAGGPNLPVVQAEASGNNDASTTFSPFYGAPFYGAPFYGAPFYGAPFYGAPFYGAPFYGASAGYSPFYGAPFYGAPFYGAADDTAAEANSLLAESSQTGQVTQSVQADTWNDTGNFYVEVVSSDGTFSPTPYTLTVNTTGGPCQGVTLQSFSSDLGTSIQGNAFPATTLNASGQPFSTVIVDNSSSSGLPQVSTAPLSSSLTTLAADTNGAILDVSQSKGVQELMAQAASNPGCPYAANLEAQGIQALINTFRSSSSPGNLKYVVIIGDDHVIPFFRYADAETIGPENTYQVPVASNSAAEAALANDFYLTDNQYGAASELAIDSTLLPIQSAAVGRLVETPADIQQAIQGYLNLYRLNNGVVKPTSTLTTGYSFMANPATEAGQYFADGVPGTTTGPNYNDSLIDPVVGGTAWSATQLVTSLTTRPHQLVFLGAHFNASEALAADDSSILSTQQFASSIGANLQSAVVLGAGCHAGYTVDPADATPVTNPLSWPQAMTEAGATLIAGTGYQFGDSNYVADSDQVYVDVAQQLYQTGGGPVAVGAALLDAEAQYLASLDQLNGLEEKSLLEVTLYGLPMLSVQEPAASTSPVPTPSQNGLLNTNTSANPNLIGSPSPGSILGTQEYGVDVQVPNLSSSSYTPPGTNLSYDQLPSSIPVTSNVSQVTNGGEVADPGSPVVPVMTADVNVPNTTLTGVGFFGGSYTDTPVAAPLTGDPVTDTSQAATPFSSPVYYPERLTNPNYFGTLDTGSGTELGITPEQYVSNPGGGATKRDFSDLNLALFYSNNTTNYGGNVPALAAPPDISNVTSTETSDGLVTVSATVTGDPSAGLQEVWTTFTDPPGNGSTTGKWQSVDLTQSSTNATLWTGTFTDTQPGQAVFMVQAANGIGEVSMDNNQGYFFSPTLLSSTGTPPALATSSITINSQNSTTYGSAATVSATLSSAPAGGPSANLSGGQVTFTIGSVTATATTNSNGVATAQMPLSGLTPGPYTLVASFAGDSTDTPTSTSQAFTVGPAPTSLVLNMSTPAQCGSGPQNGLSATLTSGSGPGSGVAQKTVYFDVYSGGTLVTGTTGVTNQCGVAQAGAISLPSGYADGSYSVEAFFGANPTPLPANPNYDAADPDYAGSNSGPPAPVTIVGTSLVATPKPAVYGQTVTLTATVTPASAPGTVTFTQGGQTLCTKAVSAGTATCAVTGLRPGTYTFSASYSPASSGFQSTGPATATDTVFTNTISSPHNGAITVGSGQSLLITSSVTGPITVQPGGALIVNGGTVTGPITSTGAVALTLCGATVTGPLSVTGSTGYVFIGGGTATGCAPTKVTGPITLSNNTAGVEIANTSVTGSVSVTGNSGYGPIVQNGLYPPTEVAGNKIGGTLSCSGNTDPPGTNTPAITDAGQSNTASVKSGQCDVPSTF